MKKIQHYITVRGEVLPTPLCMKLHVYLINVNNYILFNVRCGTLFTGRIFIIRSDQYVVGCSVLLYEMVIELEQSDSD